jgi:AcrR family transcriptional regulator
VSTVDARSTRDRIADAAIACFAENGMEGTTLEVVAERAGVHRVTLHRVFPGGRAELIVEVVERAVERIATRVRRAVAKAPTAADAAVEAAASAVLEARRDPALVRAVASTEAQQAVLSTTGTPLHAVVTEMWSLIRERAEATGEQVVDGDPALLVNHWGRVLMGLTTNPVGVETPAKLRRYLRTLVVPALVGPPPP